MAYMAPLKPDKSADLYNKPTLKPLSGIIMKYAVLVGGITKVALTKIDVFDTFDEIENYLLENSINGDLLITMGAGDIVKVGENLLGI